MIDKLRFQEFLAKYKENFVNFNWKKEKYKWEAIKCFQDNWDVNASDFPGMLKRSLAKTYNFLASMNNFPGRMILQFAEAFPEEVRAMYIDGSSGSIIWMELLRNIGHWVILTIWNPLMR